MNCGKMDAFFICILPCSRAETRAMASSTDNKVEYFMSLERVAIAVATKPNTRNILQLASN